MPLDPRITLTHGFLNSVIKFGSRPAIDVAGSAVSYTALLEKATSIAATLAVHKIADGPLLTAVFAYRSVTAFAGVLGTLLHGHGYVPLNRTFPPERTQVMLRRSACRTIIVDEESENQLGQILTGIDYQMIVILPEAHDIQKLSKEWPLHRFIGAKNLAPTAQWRPEPISPDSVAYLIFTSGSTGVPKAVMVSHRNARAYIDFVVERFSVTHEDRFSQTFDMTFDLSVADMFVAWERGACVCCPSKNLLINPGCFINEAKLTIWFSVPSTAVFMKRFGGLKEGSYPNLRVSLFCGEALPVEVVKSWELAAPNSIIENLYGPTELTIACMYYRWDRNNSPAEVERGIVPIGEPFPGMVALIVDDCLAEVEPGSIGELLMSGPQLSLGYWRDAVSTSALFFRPAGQSEIFYRTGDRVRKPITVDGPMQYLGRADNQIKILGHRVELGEIESVIREESGIDGVVALGWPINHGGAVGVEIFIQSEDPVCPDLHERIATRLPVYMTPRKYHCFPQLPLNANGKFDRRALLNILEKLACIQAN